MRLIPRPPISGGAAGPLLRCRIESASDAAVLHAEGEVDMSTAPKLEGAIAAAFRAASRVIVNLSRAQYLDGSGVRVLEAAARRHPRRFVVVASNRDIHRLFEILDLANALPVVSSVTAAREYLRLE